MPKYVVTGYLVTNHSVLVEADNEEEASELGEELILSGNGVSGLDDSAWHDDFEVRLDDEGDGYGVR